MTKHPTRGFTIIELAVVLGVMSIIAAAVLPDFIESMRNQLAYRMVKDIELLAEAARWAYVESTNPNTPDQAHWPGYDKDCAYQGDPIDAMVAAGYLAKRPQDPWGGNYSVTVTGECLLRIWTAAGSPPASVMGIIQTGLSQVSCNENVTTGPSPYNTVGRCMVSFPKPGHMASLQSAISSCTGP